MKRINIQSLLQANASLQEDGFKRFLMHYGIEIKSGEIEDLRSLSEILSVTGCGIMFFDKFYVGYKIPQIGKEFDLLRFGKKCIVNIELKKTSTKEKIKRQLIRNRYYLKFIGRRVYTFTFVSESQELYFLRDDDQLELVNFYCLADYLNSQEIDDEEVVDSLFDPSDYLVSPFNSTQKFLNNEYFLTHQQEEVKDKIIGSLGLSKAARFISIVGSAGTGKTLLTYDIAKELVNGKRNPLIIHCGQLNGGHWELKRSGWAIVPIKSYGGCDFSKHDLVIIDEAQRIYPEQLDAIVDKVNFTKGCCIFSHDKVQTLARWEEIKDVSAKIDAIKSITQYKLSEKIRTNKEIAAFIKMLFNKKRNLELSRNCGIEINYFCSIGDAKSYLDGLDGGQWEVLRFTPSQYNNEHHEKYSEASSKTSHQVIGQEYDGVVVTIDKYFYYNDDGELAYRGKAYYHPPKMLFQNITRSRKRLNLVIIDNEELLDRCIAILQ